MPYPSLQLSPETEERLLAFAERHGRPPIVWDEGTRSGLEMLRVPGEGDDAVVNRMIDRADIMVVPTEPPVPPMPPLPTDQP